MKRKGVKKPRRIYRTKTVLNTLASETGKCRFAIPCQEPISENCLYLSFCRKHCHCFWVKGNKKRREFFEEKGVTIRKRNNRLASVKRAKQLKIDWFKG